MTKLLLACTALLSFATAHAGIEPRACGGYYKDYPQDHMDRKTNQKIKTIYANAYERTIQIWLKKKNSEIVYSGSFELTSGNRYCSTPDESENPSGVGCINASVSNTTLTIISLDSNFNVEGCQRSNGAAGYRGDDSSCYDRENGTEDGSFVSAFSSSDRPGSQDNDFRLPKEPCPQK